MHWYHSITTSRDDASDQIKHGWAGYKSLNIIHLEPVHLLFGVFPNNLACVITVHQALNGNHFDLYSTI